MKKVFTKVMDHTVDIGSQLEEYVLDNWVAQEDLLILGFVYSCNLQLAAENDGLAWGIMDLTQSSAMGKDGSLGLVGFNEYWNTAPAFGVVNPAQGSIFYAAGKEVSLTEGDELSLLTRVAGKTAGMSRWNVNFVIYYTKARGR